MSTILSLKTIINAAGRKLFEPAAESALHGNYRCCNPLITASSLRFLATGPPTNPPASGSKPIFPRDKPHCNVGTIGHFAHGKTTLTAAITKVLSEKKLASEKNIAEIDNTAEEKKRGHSIKNSRVEYWTESRHYGHTDCPGHKDFIKQIITGTTLLDGAILVVAAAEGIMPQTKEHLMLAKQAGIDRIVVYINKTDVADEETVKLIESELRELMTSMGMDGEKSPFISGSALCALQDTKPEIGKDSVSKLLEAIDSYVPNPVRDLEKPFMLPIDNIFNIPGVGTVVAGRLERGILKKGQECELVGYGKTFKTTITSLETFYKTLEDARAGDQMDACIRGVRKDDICRGMALCQPGTVSAYDNIEVQFSAITPEEGGRNASFGTYFQAMMFSKTWDCQSSVLIPDEKMVMPGEDAKFVLRLSKPMVMEEGQRFTLRDGNRLIGFGVTTKFLPNQTTQEKVDMAKGAKKRAKEAKKQKPQG